MRRRNPDTSPREESAIVWSDTGVTSIGWQTVRTGFEEPYLYAEAKQIVCSDSSLNNRASMSESWDTVAMLKFWSAGGREFEPRPGNG